MKNILGSVLALALSATALPVVSDAQASPLITATPSQASFGTPIGVEARNLDGMAYMPATRYRKAGDRIVVDYEIMGSTFGPFPPSMGLSPIAIGELAPGTYQLEGRFHDIANPKAGPQVASGKITVAPPEAWGLHLVPREPAAFQRFEVVVRSAAYFDPSSIRATVSGNLVRIDFTYDPQAPATLTVPPPGMVTTAAVAVDQLPPGYFRVEGWGTRKSGGASERYFETLLGIDSAIEVAEFYSPGLDHYFVAGAPDEVALLDRGAQGDWMRTGFKFRAWLRQTDAPAAAKPICRFYASGPNSHFYTGDESECAFLKSLEAQGRAEASRTGKAFPGWAYEGIAFHALVPTQGLCPAGSEPVYRAYNNRAAQGDSNHRFMPDARMRQAMAVSWVDEGVAFCSPK